MNIPYYQIFADQNPNKLTLLHSGGMCGQEWKPQIETLQTRFCLLVPDLPGHGRTLLDGDLSIKKIAEAVINMLDDAGVEKTSICGSSMGAAAAMYLVLNYPERIEAAIFFRMSYRKTHGAYEQTCKMADPEYWRQYGMHNWLAKIHQPQGSNDAWKTVIKRVCSSLNPETTDHNHDLSDFSKIEIPVMIISGDRDPVCPLDDALALHRTIKNSSLWIMPETNHISSTNTWRSDIFAQEIIRFLSKKLEK